MKFLSICSGIEAASVAWNPLGWESVGFSEIEPFPCAVLKHRFPNVKNYGDMTRYESWNITAGTIDLVCGGTPCQSFSVAGKRGGLDDARGNLMLVYLRILDAVRPRWVVWENVPGVLSSNSGRDFGTFLGGLGQLGYGFAYRVLDAQYFGVPQRRRRVFVVGYFGGWRPAAAVLFERASLSGDPAPRREAGQGTAAVAGIGSYRGGFGRESDVAPCLQSSGGQDERGVRNALIAQVAPTIPARRSGGGGLGTDFDCDGGLIAGAVTSKWAKGTGGPAGDECYNLTVAHALRADGFDASEDGTGRGTPLVVMTNAVAIRTANTGANGHGIADGISHTLDGAMGQAVAVARGFQWQSGFGDSGSEEISGTVVKNQTPAVMQAVAVESVTYTHPVITTGHQGDNVVGDGDVFPCVPAQAGNNGGGGGTLCHTGSVVRRLTPRECERLQGFPDDWTRIPWRGKPEAECPDGPRYKAIGNSWAVPCARWIGERIEMVEKIL